MSRRDGGASGSAPRSGGRGGVARDGRTDGPRTSAAPRRDDDGPDRRASAPPLFDEAQVEILERRVRDALAILGAELALRVGRHLAATGLLLDDDPEQALAHARYARQRAARLPEVREALGVAAYVNGDFALARAELRTVRRMTTGAASVAVLPLLADCERALGRPDEALALAAAPDAVRLDGDDRIELALVEAGARLDLGQPQQALRVLTRPELTTPDDAVTGPTLRLWYGYAESLLAAGRPEEARSWFVRVAELGDDLTDAEDRVAALDQQPTADADELDGR